MKDKLRELAKWCTQPVSEERAEELSRNDYELGLHQGQKEMGDRILAIIDADGDGGAVTSQDALIYAGDQYTDKYKDDDRQDIKTDVLNAFYQGANWMRKTNPIFF